MFISKEEMLRGLAIGLATLNPNARLEDFEF